MDQTQGKTQQQGIGNRLPQKGDAVIFRDRSHKGYDGSIEHAALVTGIKQNGILALTAFPAGSQPYTATDVRQGFGSENTGEECWYWPANMSHAGMQDGQSEQPARRPL